MKMKVRVNVAHTSASNDEQLVVARLQQCADCKEGKEKEDTGCEILIAPGDKRSDKCKIRLDVRCVEGKTQ